jgi:DNA-binding MarR family transcriptional regulator
MMPDLECACANVRRAARLVTQLYSHEMGTGIEPSQFSLLMALTRKPGCSQAWLGSFLGLDKTSLSRNLQLMKKNGWILNTKSDDRRERGYRLSAAGKRVLDETQPAWSRAQTRLRESMSAEEWDLMQRAFGIVARAAAQAPGRVNATSTSRSAARP